MDNAEVPEENRPKNDPFVRDVEDGASGTVAANVTGANIGDGVSGSLSGAMVSNLTGENMMNAETSRDEEALPPMDLDALSAFAPSGGDTAPPEASPSQDAESPA